MPLTPEVEEFVNSAHALMARFRMVKSLSPSDIPLLIHTLFQVVEVVCSRDAENHSSENFSKYGHS